MNCINCNGPIEEPQITHSKKCPNCGVLLLIPSKKDWEALRAYSTIKEMDNDC
jgi:DNA-directed RNA polymerase subunit RPC12/RpoP